MHKYLLTGGSGLLGKELQKYLDCYAPSHEVLDITKPIKTTKKYETIIHCAAYTDVTRAESDRVKCFRTNVVGTYNLLKAFPEAKFIYISTEYAYNPVNFYSFTKLWGEEVVRSNTYDYLIIRTIFKPTPWQYGMAFKDQYTTGDYVDIIAQLIVKEILKNTQGTLHIGTGRKTMYDLAKRTRHNVVPNSIKDIKGVKLPEDYQ